MLISCTNDDRKLLASCVGKKIKIVTAYKHPNVSAYSLILLQFENDRKVILELKSVDIVFKFEVFIVKASERTPIEASYFGQDKFVLNDFLVKEIDVIRRVEWLEGDSGSPRHEADAGLIIRSSNGTEIALEADAFPLTFQFRFSAVGSGGFEKSTKRLIALS